MYGEFIGVCSYNIQVSKITILFINKMGNGGYWNGEFIGVWSFYSSIKYKKNICS